MNKKSGRIPEPENVNEGVFIVAVFLHKNYSVPLVFSIFSFHSPTFNVGMPSVALPPIC